MKKDSTPNLERSLPAWRQISPAFLLLLAVFVSLVVVLVTMSGTWPEAIAKAEAAGKKVRVSMVAQVWSWWGLLIDAILALILLITFKWWKGKRSDPPLFTNPAPTWHWWVFAGLLLFATFMRWPRMDLSLYNDEGYNYVRQVAGIWKPDAKSGELVFREATWQETLWLNTSGNNSQIHSILSRGSYDLWRSVTGSPKGELGETALRFPALIAGLGSLLFLGLALRSMAGTAAAFWVMVAGAVHPWHLRYSTEARGYSLMLLGIAMTWYFLDRAIKQGHWRYWLGYGAGVLLTIWGFPGAFYFLLVQTCLLMLRQLVLWWRAREPVDQVIRPVIACVFAVMVALAVMLPLVPGLLETLKKGFAIQGEMTTSWWQDLAGYLLVGCRWLDISPENPLSICVTRVLAAQPWAWLLIGFSALTAVLGAVRLIKWGGAARLLALSGPLAVLLAWSAMSAKGNYLHHWYAIYALPSVLGMWAVGLGAWLKILQFNKASNTAGLSVAVQVVFGVILLAVPWTVALPWRHLSKQENRAPILTVRGNTWPHIQPSSTLLAATWSLSDIYDPSTLILKGDGDLAAVIQRARTEQRDLYVTYSHKDLARVALPQTLATLQDKAQFEKVATYYGQEEPQYDVHLYHLKLQP